MARGDDRKSAPALQGDKVLDALRRIDAWLAKHRKRFHAGLLPGTSDADLAALAAALSKPLPEKLRTLLNWHNGQDADVYGGFERSFSLMSAQQIAETFKALEAEPRNGWKPGLIPFLDDDQDDYVCLDTTQPAMSVVECWRGQTAPIAAAPSLTAWLESFATAIEKGEYLEDPERGSFQRKA